MYLDYFKLKEPPFTLTPNIHFYCELKGHQEAMNTLLFCIRSGEGFIKIMGEVGSGKTLLCRKLLDMLGPEFVTAYIPNPDLQPNELRMAFARELGIDPSKAADSYELLTMVNRLLLDFHAQGKRVVLLLDEAQALPEQSLEALRLLTNLETETSKLLQVVLFAQPELDERLKSSHLRQLNQRITFSYYLPLLSRDDMETYLVHRLAIAGYTYGSLFSKKTKDLLYRSSRGVPRLINILAHKAMLMSYAKGETIVSRRSLRSAVKDTEHVLGIKSSKLKWLLVLWSLGLIVLLLGYHLR
jgi:MSHA biogenesis protein MshM